MNSTKELGIITERKSKRLNISAMLDRDDLDHIQMTEIPKGYFTTIKSRNGKELKFFNSLLQITVRSHGIIFDLDTTREVESIENIDQL